MRQHRWWLHTALIVGAVVSFMFFVGWMSRPWWEYAFLLHERFKDADPREIGDGFEVFADALFLSGLLEVSRGQVQSAS